MKKLLSFLCMLFAVFHCMAADYGFNPKTDMVFREPKDTEPTQNVTFSNSGISVSYEITAVNMITDDVFTTTYNASIPSFGNTSIEAQPAYPFKADRFELPEGCENVSVTITSSSYRDRSVLLAPARILIPDSEDYTFTQQNIQKISSAAITSANNILAYNNIIEKDGKKWIEVGLQPIQYSKTDGKIRVYYNFTYEISYLDASGSPIQIVPVEQELSLQPLKKSYLILSKPEFGEICENFASHKKLMGYTTYVVLSDNWTPSAVKQTIADYRNEPFYHSLKFVLLVGGNNIVPSNSVNTPIYHEGDKTYLCDYLYGCLDSDYDFEQDVYIGRIPANNAAEAEVAINKIVKYEWDPITDADFYNNSLHCAYYETKNSPNYTSRYFVWTSERIYDGVFDEGYDIARVYAKSSNSNPTYYRNLISKKTQLLPAEIRESTFIWNGTAQDVINNINRGVFYVLHRDHGAAYGWGNPKFWISDIDKLSNGDKLPVVFSINCLTGNFQGNCFASKLLTKENGGSVGVIAASEVSYSPINDYLALAMFNSIWRNSNLVPSFMNQHGFYRNKPVYSLAEILDEGMEYLCYKNGSYDKYYRATRQRFHIFGDPSMMIHTQQPVKYDKHDVQIQKTSSMGTKIDISLNNEKNDVYMAISDDNNAEIYYGTNIEYSGIVKPTTRIYIYGPNYKPTYVRTGVESYPMTDNTDYSFLLVNNNLLLNRENFYYNRNLTVNIYTTNMNVVKTAQWAADQDSLQIDLTTLEAGLYIVSVIDNGVVKKSWNIKL